MIRKLCAAALLALLPSSLPAVELGDDGLHIAPWINETFRDLREDLEEATANGQRFVVMIEQRGCIYCTQMHEEVYVIPEIEELLTEAFFVVRINMYGQTEVTDLDGETMSESEIVRRWSTMFTPTTFFLPEQVEDGLTVPQAAVAMVPGAFGRWTTFNMLNWVLEEGYDSGEPFQAYHARLLSDQISQGN